MGDNEKYILGAGSDQCRNARSLRVILSSLKNGTVELATIFRYNNG